MEITLLYGMQPYWSMWLSMTRTVPFTPSGTRLLIGATGLHCSTAVLTAMCFHKGRVRVRSNKNTGNAEKENPPDYRTKFTIFYFLCWKKHNK